MEDALTEGRPDFRSRTCCEMGMFDMRFCDQSNTHGIVLESGHAGKVKIKKPILKFVREPS